LLCNSPGYSARDVCCGDPARVRICLSSSGFGSKAKEEQDRDVEVSGWDMVVRWE